MTRQVTLIRGLPGSGKTTLAKLLCKHFNGSLIGNARWVYFEADQFFETADGEYTYDPAKVPEAHANCLKRYSDWLSSSENRSAIVSNTFVHLWEILPYIIFARRNNIPVQIITCDGRFGNTHNVPDDVYDRMAHEWENFTLDAAIFEAENQD